jgi:hypothetical protein
MRSVSIPLAATHAEFGIYYTELRAADRLTARMYSVEPSTSTNGDKPVWQGPDRRCDDSVSAGVGAGLKRSRCGKLRPSWGLKSSPCEDLSVMR